LDASADFPYFTGDFQDVDGVACEENGDCRTEAAEAGADDDDLSI
jgi:hypothetical protein